MYRIPRAKRRLLIVSMVALVCNVHSKTYQSRQINWNTLRSSFTVGSSRRYAMHTIKMIRFFSAVLLGFLIVHHFVLGCSSGGSDLAGLSRCAIRCLTAACLALVWFFGVVISGFWSTYLFFNVSVQSPP